MANINELKARLEFRKAALNEARSAYLDIVKGRAKSYAVGSRNISKHNISELLDMINDLEKEVDRIETALAGGSPRRAVAVIPRDL